ncbi:peptidogalycan biosysnthesis protein, partial [Porticoccus sp.]|nr:peptidogalycan biosysnthesis protein [Porticoccus sp.]
GIEFSIEKNLSYFDAGAQGEHKISRGFVPIEVYSAHWIEHPDFSDAIQKFLNQEEVHIKEYINLASNKLPYK